MPPISGTLLLAKPFRRWSGILLLLILAMAGVGALWQWQSVLPTGRERPGPSLNAEAVRNFASAARRSHCWFTEIDKSGRPTRGAETASGSPEFTRAVLSLLPIREVDFTAPMSFSGPQYTIIILTGNRGVQIGICCQAPEEGDGLLIEYHGRKYTGGNAAEFLAAISGLPLRDMREVKKTPKLPTQDE